jgi:hypothetical protein
MKTIGPALALLLAAGAAGAVDRRPIVYSVPAPLTDVIVEGSLSFPPGSLKSPDNLRLADSGAEIPSAVVEKSLWFDGSVMLLKLRFRGSRLAERRIWAEWGGGIRAKHGSIAPGGGKAAEFKVFDSASDIRVQGNVNIGTLIVRVEKRAGIYYYWYLIPLALILGVLIRRKYLLRRR